jgi:hypothetical protein
MSKSAHFRTIAGLLQDYYVDVLSTRKTVPTRSQEDIEIGHIVKMVVPVTKERRSVKKPLA